MGYENASFNEVYEACRLANASDFIKRLPDGYGTRVGERGVQLSGGQKQRIDLLKVSFLAIARAIVKNPRILLLDEATSALDSESESIVQEALEQAQIGRTTIIVAHRLSTIKNVDQIFVFKNGEIVEQGTNSELMQKRGIFYDMIQTQILREEKQEEDYDSDEESDDTLSPIGLKQKTFITRRKVSEKSGVSYTSSIQSLQHEMEEIRAEPTSLSKVFYFNKDAWSYFFLGLFGCLVFASDEESDDTLSPIGLKQKTFITRRKVSEKSGVSYTSSIQSLQHEMEVCRGERDAWSYFFLGLFGCLVFGAITPLFALVYAQIIEVYSKPLKQMQTEVVFWCSAFIVIGLLHGTGFFISANALGRCGESLTKKLRFEAFRNLIRQDIGFFDDIRHGTGKLCTRFATDAPNVRYVFTRLPSVISSVVTIIGALIVGFIFGWQLALILTVMVPLIIGSGYFEMQMQVFTRLPSVISSVVTIIGALIVGFIFGWQLALILTVMVPLIIGSGYFEMQMQYGKKMRDSKLLEEAGKIASQAVENIRTVHALNRQEQFHFMYCEYLKEPHKENMCQAHTYAAVFAFSQSLLFFMYALAFWIGAIFVDDHQMQPTDVYRVFFAFMFCGQVVGNISSFIPDVIKARLAASLIFYLIEYPSEIDSLSQDGLLKRLSGHMMLRNVYFNYPTRKHTQILRGLNLEVKPGSTVALVGKSGCGKSTIMALFERFYNPKKGVIMVDGENIRNINIRNLRQQICIVSQEPTLFNSTIRDNICYGLESNRPSYEQIVRAAKMANIHDFILGLPEGYDTQVGEKGTQLSGGQKQRIAIARALIRDPPILLLDEATSALDTESEKIVQDALEKARRGRTCVVIAHRLSTIQDSDVIVIIQNGKAVEMGKYARNCCAYKSISTHEQLLMKCDLYKRLCDTQRLVEF
ncbi:ABC transporter, ATP-binding protein [Dictyocaulus viviparus]|uniref:ABC-type xenobiotic transporter n=1 Tax=Dictyocaulus viviparus TaxID=29172 RepID=A0A0D8XGP2_DICVI|nr:ABC transporter, ATP-binding protein [Dictyocaulus viviparus]